MSGYEETFGKMFPIDGEEASADSSGASQERPSALRQAMLYGTRQDPDAFAKAAALAGQSNLPVEVAVRNLGHLQAMQKFQEIDFAAVSRDFPATAAFLQNPLHAAQAHDDQALLDSEALSLPLRVILYEKKNPFMDRVGQRLRGGYLGLKRGFATVEARNVSAILGDFDKIDAGIGVDTASLPPVARNAILRYQGINPEEKDAMRQEFQEMLGGSVSSIAGYTRESAAIPRNPAATAMIRRANKGDWPAAFDAFLESPVGMVGQVGGESLPQMIPGLALAPFLGPVAGLGTGSFVADYNAQLGENLQKMGFNLTDPEQLKKALREPEIVQKASDGATLHALAVGLFDALSVGIAGKTLAPASLGSRTARQAVNIPAQMGVQGAMGAAGEAAGQLLAGDPLQGGEVLAEFLGEFVQAPVEVMAATGALYGDLRGIQQAYQDLDAINATMARASQSKLRTRNAAAFQEWAKGVSDQSGVQDVAIPAEKLNEFFQSLPAEEVHRLAKEIGLDREALANAALSGADVEINLDAYMVHFMDHHSRLAKDLRIRRESPTVNEADGQEKRLAEEFRRTLADLQKEISQEMEALPASQKIFQELMQGQVAALVSPKEARTNAQLYTAGIVTMAKRAGVEPLELFRRYPVTFNRVLSENTARRIEKGDVLDDMLDAVRKGKIPTEDQVNGLSLVEVLRKIGVAPDSELDALDFQKKTRRPFKRNAMRDDYRSLALDEIGPTLKSYGFLSDVAEDDPRLIDSSFILEVIRDELAGIRHTSETQINQELKGQRDALLDLADLIDQAGIDLTAMDNKAARDAIDRLKEQFNSQEEGTTLNHGAWHGSPRQFSRFSLEHLGAGRASQVYGWGLYFSEARDVAEHYRETLASSAQVLKIDGEPFMAAINADDAASSPSDLGKVGDTITEIVGFLTYGAGGNIDQVLQAYRQEIKHTKDSINLFERGLETYSVEQLGGIQAMEAHERNYERLERLEHGLQTAENFKEEYAESKITIEDEGRVYRVDLSPELGAYLNWDSPLSKQSEEVRAALESAAAELGVTWEKDTPGSAIYQRVADAMPPKGVASETVNERQRQASLFLRSKGVPGIKYKDQMLRNPDGSDPGVHNFVLFDDALVKIQEFFQSNPQALAQAKEVAEKQGEVTIQQSPQDGVRELFQPLNPGIDLDQEVPILEVPKVGYAEGAMAAAEAGSQKNLVIPDSSKPLKISIKSDGRDVLLGRKAFRHAVSSFVKSIDKWAHLDATRALPDLIENAVLVEQHADNKHGRAEIKQILRYFSAFRHEGQVYAAKLTVKEYWGEPATVEVEGVSRFYDLSVPKRAGEINGGPRADSSTPAPSLRTSPEGHAPTEIQNTVTLRQLLKGLKDEKGTPYFSSTPAGKRGSILFRRIGDTLKSAITLLRKSDPSTIPHEFGHVYLEMLADLAQEPGADATLVADLQVALNFLGVSSREEIQTQHHEQWARAFEAYLMEGKAPSEELRGAFSRFRAWLLAIYRQLANLDVEMNDALRGVFDRILASDQEIEHVRKQQRIAPAFADAEAAGLTEAEFQRYLAKTQEAVQTAKDDLTARLMRDEIRVRKEVWDQQYPRIRQEVEEEVIRRPAYQALHFLQRGELLGEPGMDVDPFKLSRAGIEQVAPGTLADLPGRGRWSVYRKEGGVHPDDAAALFGFDSGADLVQALVSVKGQPLKDVIDAEAEARFRAEFGNLLDKGEITDAALETLHNDARYQWLTEEHVILSGKAAQRPARAEEGKSDATVQASGIGVKVRAAMEREAQQDPEEKARAAVAFKMKTMREYAERVFEDKTVHEAQLLGPYSRLELRAAKATEEAIARQDYAAAEREKFKQILNHLNYRLALESRQEVSQAMQIVSRLQKPDYRKGIDPEYLRQIDALLTTINFGVMTRREVQRTGELRRFVDQARAEGLDIPLPDAVIDQTMLRHFSELAMREFRELMEGLKSLVHIGRSVRQIEVEGQKMDRDVLAADLMAAALMNVKERHDPKEIDPSKKSRISAILDKIHLPHLKMEFLFRELDGYKDQGLWWNVFLKPMVDAENRELEMMNSYGARLGEIFDAHYSRLELSGFKRKTVHAQSIGKRLTREELLAIALNVGNEDNRIKLMEGYGWNEGQLNGILDLLEERDWKFVQQVWDLIDSLWPDIAKQERELTGVIPQKVERTPIRTRFGVFEGGYYPLKYDPNRSGQAGENEAKGRDLFDKIYATAATRRGHTNERIGPGHEMAVMLSLGVIPHHFQQVIRDVTHRQAIRQVDALSRHRVVKQAVYETLGPQAHQLIRPWLQDLANERSDTKVPALDAIANRMRLGVTVVAMGWKVSTAIQQILGFATLPAVLGERWAFKGMAQFFKDPAGAWEFVQKNSTMMRNRPKTFDRDVRDVVRRMGLGGLTAPVRDTFFWMTAMMDMVVSSATWLGGHGKWLEEHPGDVAGAIDAGDMAVRMSQSAGGTKDLAAIQRGGGLQRLLTMFYSFFSAMYNLFAEATGKYRVSPGNVADKARLVADLWWLWFLPALASEFIVGRGPDDDDDVGKWGVRKLALYPLQSLVGVRDVANAIGGEFGTDYRVSPAFDAVQMAVNLARDLGDMTVGEEVDGGKTAKKAVMTFSYAAALPGRQAVITAEGVYDWITGKDTPDGFFDAFRQLTLVRPKEKK